ncbi:hypothetical protein A3D76_01360 [Candidatus Roizmanbacteria bacterium RIFCSPHIGHO2_02_FULL_37_9b]|nr:MAG: hypothetical protein A3D76_01360 [Candidatus Roizmanbacteria bacterium RIFCSPHIGHO2_02_FULL_37_9b]
MGNKKKSAPRCGSECSPVRCKGLLGTAKVNFFYFSAIYYFFLAKRGEEFFFFKDSATLSN